VGPAGPGPRGQNQNRAVPPEFTGTASLKKQEVVVLSPPRADASGRLPRIPGCVSIAPLPGDGSDVARAPRPLQGGHVDSSQVAKVVAAVSVAELAVVIEARRGTGRRLLLRREIITTL